MKNSWFVEITLCLICQVIIVAKDVRICASNSAGDNGEDKSLQKLCIVTQHFYY